MENFTIVKNNKISLKDFSPEDTENLSKDNINDEYLCLQEKFSEFQNILYASKKFSLLIILQGMDCSGKDGTAKKILSGINPNGFNVKSFKEPTQEELSHDYLWRVHKYCPSMGNITIFNRSYYEDVLITRVHRQINDTIAFKRFKEINKFEKYLINNNILVLKFFLHISKDFQREKIEERLKNPKKHWKFSLSDLKERNFWDKYQQCYEDIICNCSTKKAPWHIIPSNNRWFRDYIILKIIVNNLQSLKLEYPKTNDNIQALINELNNSR
ncbi:hypothetical protein CPAST_c05260 [Clostridium pasteurianum DSM 525 = ATCC 6013]|uniref:Polyphosphate:nucleotide phosphotransferase, PPK2 family n=1 Tax=Clostridium pasteurianum DSM 525 = ATCC 6013 TaxID=1262449 RepID=A0A0H3IYP2_CLOPA|nr:PPK2 family polyphosphate kinase [Clostridium pasteurianum]AJA46626.1 hypothetical protein CPAST_c05260 [Clostridium pasteurianum DSM 525 = ATCC 6013]AJA50614.1 hypothetical protein CLPA_c05260 [Clostridium pasteurianum DSM 525 = ATCC 6013]AOZ74039.1 polyphosphate kinase [Clostridium pasteurianum DSM 525 = ATCC 6013]AOZ77836.1 polyphosphate kinase [Clostridium pasteurianum]ELP61192.1 hypothetical protein F502_02015 [Clostridium pasteurianum DSM 525 = ATCC 6013]